MEKIKDWLNNYFKGASRKKKILTGFGIVFVAFILVIIISQAFG